MNTPLPGPPVATPPTMGKSATPKKPKKKSSDEQRKAVKRKWWVLIVEDKIYFYRSQSNPAPVMAWPLWKIALKLHDQSGVIELKHADRTMLVSHGDADATPLVRATGATEDGIVYFQAPDGRVLHSHDGLKPHSHDPIPNAGSFVHRRARLAQEKLALAEQAPCRGGVGDGLVGVE